MLNIGFNQCEGKGEKFLNWGCWEERVGAGGYGWWGLRRLR